jgi:hypothetical protein
LKVLYLNSYILLIVLTGTINLSCANASCPNITNSNVKVEAWLSKKYEPSYLDIIKEFKVMGKTKVGLFIYPAENPSRIVAIGRCVPVHLAQHFLSKAKKYSLGTTHLVNQAFISSNWSGLGSSLFSENSMNPITTNQLSMLMDKSLDTHSFHSLYKSFTVQRKKVSAFGLTLDNPKLLPLAN